MLARRLTARVPQKSTSLSGPETSSIPLLERGDCFMRLSRLPCFGAGTLFHAWVTTLFTPLLQTAPRRDAQCIFNLHYTSNLHTVTAHHYSRKTARSSRPWSQPTQWKRFGIWPTALSNVAALHIGGKEIQLVVVWIISITLGCLGSTGALKDIPRSIRWHLFFRLFLDTHGAIPAPPRRKVILRTTPSCRKLTFTPSNNPLPGFFQLL